MSFPPPKPNPWAFGLGVVVLLVIPHGIQLISLMAALGFSYYVHYMRQRARAALEKPDCTFTPEPKSPFAITG